MPSSPSPADDVADVVINNVAFGGDGVAHLPDGMCIFVPFTAIGDEVHVRITERRKRFARGEVVRYTSKADTHAAPACSLFGRCGGCNYQHLTADEQVRLKVQQLEELLTRVGQLENLPPVSPIVRGEKSYGYRNKLTVHAAAAGGVGLVARDNKTVLPITNCPLASEPINDRLRNRGQDAIAGRHLIMRHTGTERVTCGQPKERHRRWLTENLGGSPVRVPLTGFYQVNPEVAGRMIAWLTRTVGELKPSHILDLYCGCGVFALSLAGLAEHICGVDSDRESIAAARHNSRHWKTKNCSFIHARLEEVVDEVLTAIPNRSRAVAILDPPRSGCDAKVIKSLLASPPGHLVYISCNAATLARDLRILCADGVYEPLQLAYFDMFPQTAHFECAVVLKFRGKSKS
ncbi:MAG: tRNA/tmRNA/rRNA uracil-C5-methylase (TrmA/RlmC/RlmD family) [Rhodothermales bacterium]|jgi:tRNA/tmRNA/rRNA uracil-C5-methylase (TrmA/RlmC/RlmD family)